MGVTILAQKCEWVTHTLRGSDTPPWGALPGLCFGQGGFVCPMASWTASGIKGFGWLRTCVYSRYARVDRGRQGVGPGVGLLLPRLPDGGWVDA